MIRLDTLVFGVSASARFVPMVQTTDMRDRHDGAIGLRGHGSRHWRFFVERKMGPASQVILCVSVQDAPQSACIDHQDVVETLAPD
jgi:hypothetical protein